MSADAVFVLVIVAIVLWRSRRRIAKWISRTRASPLADPKGLGSATSLWTAADQRLLHAARLAADLRRSPPPARQAPFLLQRGELLLFSPSSCEVSIQQIEQVAYPRWGTRLIQKSIAGYFVTPLINAIRNARAREKAKRQMLRNATWSKPSPATIHLTNQRVIINSAEIDEGILLRSVSRISRGDSNVLFQVGTETKTTLPGQVVIYSPNADWLYVALVYSAQGKVPKLNLSEAFKARAAQAGHDLSGLEG